MSPILKKCCTASPLSILPEPFNSEDEKVILLKTYFATCFSKFALELIELLKPETTSYSTNECLIFSRRVCFHGKIHLWSPVRLFTEKYSS